MLETLVLLLAIWIGLQFAPPLFQQNFYEQDLNLSHPYQENMSVPVYLLYILTWGVPLGFSLVVLLNPWECFGGLQKKRKGLKKLYFYVCLTILSTSIMITGLKLCVGEPRPNFFAYCNYWNYRDAVQEQNYTYYLNQTKFGVMGNISHCLNSDKIQDAFQSWPSGHAGLLFASTVATSLLLSSLAQNSPFSLVRFSVPYFIMGLILLAVWVALTRVQEYWHRTNDIFAGSIIGVLNALVWWYKVFVHTRPKKLEPLLLTNNSMDA